jgi:hypothetical protein
MRFRSSRICLSCGAFLVAVAFVVAVAFLVVIPVGDLLLPLSLLFLFVIPEGICFLLLLLRLLLGSPRLQPWISHQSKKKKGLQPLGCVLQTIPTSENPVNPHTALTPSTPTTSKWQLIPLTPL